MRRVRLETGEGRFVAFVDVMPFVDGAHPSVVVWGARTFVFESREKGGVHVYEEAFAVVSLTPSPGHRSMRDEPPPPVDRSARTTTSGEPITEATTTLRPDGQQHDYVILTAGERAKGYVRPVRCSYKHLKCGTVTTMGRSIAETYARDPSFYSATFCVGCGTHSPVGPAGEFVWEGTSEKVGAPVPRDPDQTPVPA